MRAFISHCPSDDAQAAEVQRRLEAEGLGARTDLSHAPTGAPVDRELLAGIRASDLLLLVWSKAAEASNRVAAEWLVALQEEKLVVPCSLDETEFPTCLRNARFVDLRWEWDRVVAELVRMAKETPQLKTRVVVPDRGSRSTQTVVAIERMNAGQAGVLERLRVRDQPGARLAHGALDAKLEDIRLRWPRDALVITLEGHHHENAYRVAHADSIHAGLRPSDPVLEQAERCFLRALSIDPTEPAAIHAMGSYLWFLGEYEAAQLFTRKAIEHASRQGAATRSYERDLAAIQRDLAAGTAGG